MNFQMQRICGIYKITNTVNGKSYIGQSVNIDARWKEHVWYGKGDRGAKRCASFSILHMAMKKYGISKFKFSIIEECGVEDLDAREIYWISEENSIAPNGYNVYAGGQANRKRIVPQNKCIDCGCDIGRDSLRCTPCNVKKIMGRFDGYSAIEEIGKRIYSGEKMVNCSVGGVGMPAVIRCLRRRGLPHTKKEIVKIYCEKHGIEMKAKAKKRECCREVLQYDLNGNFIAEYSSIREASRSLNIHENLIYKAVNGELKKTHGFIWKSKYIDNLKSNGLTI